MRHEWHVFREFGFRYWVAYVLVRIAYHVKDTTTYQVIRDDDGLSAMIYADSWGTGVSMTCGIPFDSDDDPATSWPRIREFDDLDDALDWMRDIKPDQEAAA